METKTELRRIADRIGLGAYPEELERFYDNTTGPACDLQLIDRLQEQYDLFGKYYPLVVQSAQQINENPDLNTWTKTAIAFNRENDLPTACKLPVPTISENVATNFLMLHILIPTIPGAFADLESRGFTWDELEDARITYKSALDIVQSQTGFPAINGTYFWWLNLYCRALIFKLSGFWFEIQKFPDHVLWLQNRHTGNIVPLMEGTFHCDGTMPLGALYFDDAEGSFAADYSEDDGNYYGHGCVDHVIDSKKKAYPKVDWVCIARPGQRCLGIHIPAKADISVETTMGACKAALALVHKRFPEYSVNNAVFGSSWLLNPRMRDIQGPQSRITQLEECFVKYPNKDTTADSVFNFVFGRKPERFEDLAEDTSLQRKLKKIYLDGDCIHSYSGVIFVDM